MSDTNPTRGVREQEHELESEINEYLHEKDRIRKILEGVGGVPQRREKFLDRVFLVLVGVAFLVAVFIQDPKNLPLEIAVLLVSLKLLVVLRQNAKMNHFQFWMLSTLEWRVNDISKDLSKLKKRLGASTEDEKTTAP